jgi:hypothetical protein
MFYYIEVHLLAHYIQWNKMHGETVKLNELLQHVSVQVHHFNGQNDASSLKTKMLLQSCYL